MYRNWIELISKDGKHELYYGNGIRSIKHDNVSCQLMTDCDQNLFQCRARIYEIGMSLHDGPEVSWVGGYIDEWLRVYEQDDGTLKFKTVHVCEKERLTIDTDTDCDIDNAVYEENTEDE